MYYETIIQVQSIMGLSPTQRLHNIGICYFNTKHTALRTKSWLGIMLMCHTHGLLVQPSHQIQLLFIMI